ncbi:MAG: lytic transglycosylase domain-containing protein [Alphaproteobacteria bacterium]|nr:lytic transglycosylase domain-containing protein [Alphaproteobacteria bacterium]
MAFILGLLIASLSLTAPLAADQFQFGALLPEDATAYSKAFQAAKRGKWKSVYGLVKGVQDNVLLDVLRWKDLRRGASHHDFEDYRRFLTRHPNWPNRNRLIRQAEEAMDSKLSDQSVLDWFARNAPRTGRGATFYARALIRRGDQEAARREVRRAWSKLTLTRDQEKQFLREFGAWIDEPMHIARLDHLLWEGHRYAARRQAKRVPANWRKLADARLRLRRSRGGVDQAIRRVPGSLIKDAGLIYERVRWRRRRGKREEAATLLAELAGPQRRPDLVWKERAILARWSFREGEVLRAYQLAREHDLNAIAHRVEYAEAQFLSGWFAMRLGRPDRAFSHFRALHDAVEYPVSLARGAYWAGRALEAGGRPRQAQHWYGVAARYETTFYGHTGAAAAGAAPPSSLPTGPALDATDAVRFASQSLPQVITRLSEIGQDKLVEVFFRHLSRSPQGTDERLMTLVLARSIGRLDLVVVAGRHGERDHVILPQHGYPQVQPQWRLPRAKRAEPALVHAVIRQESNFNPRAISRAGARGLMQLMPATAKRVARKSRVRYARKKLTADPNVNLLLGSTYLDLLLERYRGSYILTLAAYNAGPSRVKKWIQQFGDPRDSMVNAIDWIELIPFEQTRNYVHRVLEAVPVYRRILNDELRPGRPDFTIDLLRGANPPKTAARPLPRPKPSKEAREQSASPT